MARKYQDSFNIITKLTLPRAWNVVKLKTSYWISNLRKKPLHRGMPMSISIEPTTACNLGCPECPSGLKQFTRATGNLNKEMNQRMIDSVSKHALYVTYYFQGEPYINPSFLEMVNYASQKGLYTATSTNAHFLNPKNAEATVKSGLDRLIISIDGTTQEVYEQYRKKGHLDKVIEGTKNMVEAKKELNSKTPHIIFQFLVVKPNEHQIEEVKKLGNKLGVDEVKFKTAQVYDYENGNPLIPENQKYSRYKKQKDGTYKVRGRQKDQCWRMWQGCVMTWDGNIVPCCFDKDAQHQLGSIKEVPFRELWRNRVYHGLRHQILKDRKSIDICSNCSEGSKIWI